GEHKYLRADEEMKAILAPPDVVEKEGHLKRGSVLARVQGDLATVASKEVQYIDISPRQTVSVSAALIPFLEHDDANRALMGSNMQRQAVPLLRVDPPIISTGMERPVAQNSGMLVRAERPGVVTYVDSMRILIEEYDVEIRETKLGREEFTRDIPNVSERALANLDENGIVRVGTRVGPGDILVGKVAPKSKSELTPEEKLLHAIFGRAGEDV